MLKKSILFLIIIAAATAYCCVIGLLYSFIHTPAVSRGGEDGVKVPIVMYHSVLKDTDLSGKYVITPSALEDDILYLKNSGFTFVSAKNLIDYVKNDANLPEKPVMLTFDDGFYNNYGYVLPILEKYDICAVISVVGSYTDDYSESGIANLTYGYLRWNDVCGLLQSGRVEIGNHSYDFHSNNVRSGSQRKKGESESEYKEIFCEDTKKAQNRFTDKTGFSPVIYTYPFGAYSSETTEYLKELGFQMSLTCSEGVNLITKNPDSLFLLKRYNRPSGISSSEFFDKILKDMF